MLCVLKKNTFITKSQLSARLSPLQTIRPTLPHMATKGLVHSMSTPEVHCSLIGSNEGKNIITYYVDFQSNRLPPSHPLRKERSTLNTLKNRLKISVHKSVYMLTQCDNETCHDLSHSHNRYRGSCRAWCHMFPLVEWRKACKRIIKIILLAHLHFQ